MNIKKALPINQKSFLIFFEEYFGAKL